MKYLGNHSGWRDLATACLRNAIKTADVGCIHSSIFSLLCGLAEQDEADVVIQLKYAEQMKKLYGDKWYRKELTK